MIIPFVYRNCTVTLFIQGLVTPRKNYLEWRYSIFLTTTIILELLLDLLSWKQPVNKHFVHVCARLPHSVLFTIVRAKISLKFCSELLKLPWLFKSL